jgi:hypothetical protein
MRRRYARPLEAEQPNALCPPPLFDPNRHVSMSRLHQYLYAPLTLIQPDKGKKPRKVQYGETTFVVIDATVRMATA